MLFFFLNYETDRKKQINCALIIFYNIYSVIIYKFFLTFVYAKCLINKFETVVSHFSVNIFSFA